MDQTKTGGTTSETGSGALSSADRNFVMKAAQGGMTEVQIGQMAQEKGYTDNVKQLGQKLVQDHTKANDDLKQIAERKGITLPADVDSKARSEIDRLSKLSGPEFDRAFLQHAVRDHKKDLSEFRHEAEKGKDPDVKQWAQANLSALQEHLQLAESGLGSGHGQAASAENTGRTSSSSSTTSGRRNRRNPQTDTSNNPGSTNPDKPNPNP